MLTYLGFFLTAPEDEEEVFSFSSSAAEAFLILYLSSLRGLGACKMIFFLIAPVDDEEDVSGLGFPGMRGSLDIDGFEREIGLRLNSRILKSLKKVLCSGREKSRRVWK